MGWLAVGFREILSFPFLQYEVQRVKIYYLPVIHFCLILSAYIGKNRDITMKNLMLLFALLFLSACSTMYSNDPDSLAFDIPKGSTMSLNKSLSISKSNTHGVIQFGKETTDSKRNDYEVNCRLDFKKFGPRTVKPEKFTVTRTEDGSNWISQPSILRFYTEIYLSSNKGTDVIKMVCQEYGDASDYHFTVKQIEATLGDYVSFDFAPGKNNSNNK